MFHDSWQKECSDCQKCRLAIEKAIMNRMPMDVIRTKKEAFSQHLAWMLKQRARLELITQRANHESYLVENSDKCGDSCLYLPSSSRVSSDNVGKYQYRLSLQANVYASKLFHLSLLLPSLVTGANFGITSFMCGLVKMIELKEVTPATRVFMRGVDGGSENVNHASLGMNCVLVHLGCFDVIQQHRLPPSHSHIFLTDGTFSVIEKWLTGPGSPGCPTLPELLQYLRRKFCQSKKYQDKVVYIDILLVNFAFTKWLNGHLNMDQVQYDRAQYQSQSHPC